jgi:hypothetical protein
MEDLIPIRFGRMSASPFAFYRGSAALMAADLATTPTSGIRVQACGDAHLPNFGGFAMPERNVIFDINDLDETLPAPFEWDLKRLAASAVIAAQFLEYEDRTGDPAIVEAARGRLIELDEWPLRRRLGGNADRAEMADCIRSPALREWLRNRRELTLVAQA